MEMIENTAWALFYITINMGMKAMYELWGVSDDIITIIFIITITLSYYRKGF